MQNEHLKPASQARPPAPELDRAKLADALLSSALDGIIVADAEGRIVEFNEAAERVFGFPRASILGRTMDDTIIPAQHRHAHRHGMERYLSEGVPHVLGRRVEVEGLRANGEVFPLELSIAETRMDTCRYFVATLRDLTASRKAEADLRATQATLSAIFDNIPAALYLRDLDDRLVMMNAWGADFLGQDQATMIGQPMSRYREPQNVERVREIDANIRRSGVSETHQFTYHLPQGDRTGLMTFFPVFGSGNEVTHIGGMLVDVTDLQQTQAALAQARASLQAFFDHVPAAF